MRALTLFAVTGLILAVSGTAGATTVSYTVDGWGPTSFPGPVTPPAGAPWGSDGYPGDTVELQTYTGSLNLTPGTYVQKINTLRWTVDYTYAGTETQWDYPDHWGQPSFDIDAPRDMSIGTAAGSLNQAGLLWVTWFNDDLSFAVGSTTSFVVESYRVDVTPLGLPPETNVFPAGGNPWLQPERDVMARFDVTLIPEPVTMAGMLMAVGGLAGYIRRRR